VFKGAKFKTPRQKLLVSTCQLYRALELDHPYIMESDLHPKSRDNKLMKYDDDTNLLVPETTNCTLSEEFEHIKHWAIVNKMVINMSKTKELVFNRPHPSRPRSHMPLAVDNIEQVKIARLLGVIFSGNLNFDEHVTFVLSICSQRLYLNKLLRSKGMSESKLHVIFVALIISRIVYALSAWGGFLNSQQINRINAFLRKARRFGLCSPSCLRDVSEYLRLADCRLCNRIQSHSHCLSHLLPPEKHHLGLRPRGHRYTLPICQNNLCKSSFILRSLFCFL